MYTVNPYTQRPILVGGKTYCNIYGGGEIYPDVLRRMEINDIDEKTAKKYLIVDIVENIEEFIDHGLKHYGQTKKEIAKVLDANKWNFRKVLAIYENSPYYKIPRVVPN